MHGAVKKLLHAFLTSALDRAEWSALSPGHLTQLPIGYEASWDAD